MPQGSQKKENKIKSKSKKNPIRKWAKDMNRYLTEEDKQMENKHMAEKFNVISH